jgi:uncharacterized membrane protein
MNLTELHLFLNHVPTIGMIAAMAVLLMAIATRSEDLKRASLGMLFLIALLTIPAFVTGTAAELKLTGNSEVSQSMIETHETAAFVAFWFMELTGALAWLGLWQYRRLSRLPQGTVTSVVVLGLVTFGLMARAANFGGEIRHPEIRSGPPPVENPADPPLARVIGSGMVEAKWGWPASETVHFVGLSLLFGVVLLVDLRMLGFLKGIPFSALHRLLPWGVLGFGLNVVTGILFFVGAPPTFYVTNSLFFWKLALILVAGINALYFTVLDTTWDMGAGDAAPMSAKVAAASGILLWIGVIFCGQMLPFVGRSF